MEYRVIEPHQVPMSLLLEADPSEQVIAGYLQGAWAFAAILKDQVVAACIVQPTDTGVAELFNISVHPDFQQCGIGSALLRFTLDELKHRSVQQVVLGTGTFGHQLAYYQRAGFRVDAVWKDHFLTHYPQPIFEDGIQHKDMLRLSCDLSN